MPALPPRFLVTSFFARHKDMFTFTFTVPGTQVRAAF